MKEQIGDCQTDPDHEAEETDDIDECQSTQPLGPESANIRCQTNTEKGQHEKDPAKNVRLIGRFLQDRSFGRIEKSQCEEDSERQA